MATHRPDDRHFTVIGGSVMREGASTRLAKGQIGVFDLSRTSKAGIEAVKSFKGKSLDNVYEIRMGDSPLKHANGRTGDNKAYSSVPFKITDIKEVKVSLNKVVKKVDALLIGYDGINDDTAFKFYKGDEFKLIVRFSGELIGFLGYEQSYVDVPIYLDAERCSVYRKKCVDCDECEELEALPIILEAIEVLKNYQLRGGVKVKEVAHITPIRKCETPAKSFTKTEQKFYCLDVCDTGDDTALALVQNQYAVKVLRTERKGAISTYKTMLPSTEDKPTAYKQGIPSILKGCNECPSGYTEAKGGFLYAVTLEDDGTDKSTQVEGIENAVSGTAIKGNSQTNGVGYYTVVLSQKLSDENFDTFIGANPTATISYVGTVEAMCNNATVNSIEWTECGSCKTTTQEYHIELPDNECKKDRLQELRNAYPSLNVQLEGTKGGCQTRYKATVVTNMVCEECDDIFLDTFVSEAPVEYEGAVWKLKGDSLEGTKCKVGIKIEGKEFNLSGLDWYTDKVGFLDSSVEIQASGGYMEDVFFGDEYNGKPFAVKYLSRKTMRTHKAGALGKYEDMARTYFTGQERHSNPFTRMLLGEERSLDPNADTVDYAVLINRSIFAQSISKKHDEWIWYHFIVELGKHKEVEKLVNDLASGAGLNMVQATGK